MLFRSPTVLVDEVRGFRAQGFLARHQDLVVAERAHLTMPYHREIDRLRDERPENTIGTTRKGIGPTYAKRIVELFGDKTLDVIDQSPTFLSEVKGIGPQRLERIRRSWQEQRGVREIMVFLRT